MANLKNTSINDTGFFKLPSGDTAARPSSPAATQLRFNTDTGQLEQFRPGSGAWIAPSNTGVIATGGDSVYDVETEGTSYRVHVFTATGTSTFSVLQSGEAEYLIVAGGGCGGIADDNSGGGGGGGAGGLLQGSTTVSAQSYTVTVGAGGEFDGASFTGGSPENGNNSDAFGLTAIGGGAGGGRGAPGDGGSGGGAYRDAAGGSGTAGQGNDGGSDYDGGGGGGAGAPGENANGGDGGDGLTSFITGIPTFYAGGGGGARDPGQDYGTGGLGGGGNGVDDNEGEPGTPNTGGGGAGGSTDAADRSGSGWKGGRGGDGIVIIRYPLRQNNPETAAGQDVENGLVLDLDFAKPTVYSGSGSVVSDSRLNDIEGDINGANFVNPRTHRSAFELLDNDYIGTDLTNDFFTNADGEGSILFWFRPLKDSGEQTGNDIVMSVDNPSSNRSWDFRWGESTDRIEFRTFGSLNIGLSNTINPREWYLISLTYKENDTAKLYINSQEQDSGSIGTFDNLDTTFFINAREGGGNGTAQEMGILRIYNKNLSSDEISQYYNATRWRFGV